MTLYLGIRYMDLLKGNFISNLRAAAGLQDKKKSRSCSVFEKSESVIIISLMSNYFPFAGYLSKSIDKLNRF
jgi:hypothetical protein